MEYTPVGALVRRPPKHRGPSTWPFKVQQPTTVTGFGVSVPRRQEVEFADGSRLWLLRVEYQGVPELFLRDLGAPAEGTRVDLRQLAPDLEQDLQIASSRDVAGIVHYSLRLRFTSAQALIEAAVASGRPT